ncbi:hypothetical protein AKJ48_03670 [candidate division MSBL1 archaeon SCGC-AAA261O19]|uniref:PIN domain-containing protein n=1 Tax=candidate division MSBL1 archaeon SCGC-AAA261O19 TaxID=1698277 RepID=A0A133VB99_9EURY|nr:hypothetical protein AKJ48_03670 [candidate division MSBL1 archaeon SCGC-AAA261O19]
MLELVVTPCVLTLPQALGLVESQNLYNAIILNRNMIVFDASTLILLAKIQLLRTIASETKISIPPIIKEEVTRKETTDAKLIEQLIEEGRIKVIDIRAMEEVKKLKEDFSIEEEAHAILLARERESTLATDDGQAIKVCKIFGLKFTTAIDFLIRAHERGHLSKTIALEKLRKLEEYGYYRSLIIEFARNKIGGGANEDN